jgi:RNA polymerase II subunit A-like phosphatase
LTKAAEVLDAQLEERPLSKKQDELTEQGNVAKESNGVHGSEPVTEGTTESPASAEKTDVKKTKPARKALLTNDDHELVRIRAVHHHNLFRIHIVSDQSL